MIRSDRAEMSPTLAAVSRAVADIPWTFPPGIWTELAALEARLQTARRSHFAGELGDALVEASGVVETAGTLNFEEPAAQTELERLSVSALALLGQVLSAQPSSRDAIGTFSRAATECARLQFAGAPADDTPDDAESHESDAHAAMRADVLEDALGLAPRSPLVLGALADVLIEQGRLAEAVGRLREQARALADRCRYQEALSVLERARSVLPKNRETLLGCADLLRLAGRSFDARELLHPLLEEAQDDARALAIDGLISLQERENEAASDLLAEAAALAGDRAWTHANLALARHAVGRRGDALQELDRAIELDGRQPSWLLQKAILLANGGKIGDALLLLDEILGVNPWLTVALIARAEILRSKGVLDLGLQTVELALQHDPGSVLALVTKGEILREQRDLPAAEAVLAASVAIEPSLVWALIDLGEVRAELGDTAGAGNAFDRALRLDPNNVRALSGRADVERRRGDLDAARLTVDQALSVAPESAEALTDDARVRYAADDNPGAEAQLRHAIELNPDFADAHAWLGEVLRMLDRLPEALEALDRAVALDPEAAFSRGTRGQVLLALGRIDEGIHDLQAAVDAAPSISWARESLADGLTRLGRWDEALREYELLLEEGRRVEELQVKIVGVHEAAERYEDALRIVEEMLARDGDSVAALVVKGHIQLETARFDEALENLNHAVELDRDNDWATYLRGWAHRNLGPDHADAAKADYKRAIDLDLTYPEYRQKLGELIAVLEGRAAARPHYEWVLEHLDPAARADPFDVLVLGWAQAGLADYDGAARSFRRALQVDADDVPTRFDLALALLASGRVDLALREYDDAVQRADQRHPLRRRCLLLIAERELGESLTLLRHDSSDWDEEARTAMLDTGSAIRERLAEALNTTPPPATTVSSTETVQPTPAQAERR